MVVNAPASSGVIELVTVLDFDTYENGFGLLTDQDLTIAAYTAGDAVGLGYSRDTGADTFRNIMGFTDPGTSFPVTAATGMFAAIGAAIHAGFALTVPNQT